MRAQRHRRKLSRWERFRRWMDEQHEEIRTALIAAAALATFLILMMLTKQARADEPQVVNRGGQVSCACALNGAEGACATTADWLRIRKFRVDAEGCARALVLSKEQVVLREQAASQYKSALDLSKAAVSDLQSALDARGRQVEALTKALELAKPTSHSRVLWAIIGVAVGAASTIAIGYALRPAR